VKQQKTKKISKNRMFLVLRTPLKRVSIDGYMRIYKIYRWIHADI